MGSLDFVRAEIDLHQSSIEKYVVPTLFELGLTPRQITHVLRRMSAGLALSVTLKQFAELVMGVR